MILKNVNEEGRVAWKHDAKTVHNKTKEDDINCSTR